MNKDSKCPLSNINCSIADIAKKHNQLIKNELQKWQIYCYPIFKISI